MRVSGASRVTLLWRARSAVAPGAGVEANAVANDIPCRVALAALSTLFVSIMEPWTWLIFVTEFKEIRKEWKARKKEEEAQRKAAEERERAAAAQAAQANQVEAPGAPDPTQAAAGQPPAYPGGVRPQLPPIGYQPADSQVHGGYGAAGGMVYQSNGQMAYPPNYPHSPYAQGGQVYQPRE